MYYFNLSFIQSKMNWLAELNENQQEGPPTSHHLPSLSLQAENKCVFIVSKPSVCVQKLDGIRPSASVNTGIF